MAVSFKGAHFPKEIILTGVRWYLAYPLSTRHVEELMLERGVHVDHSTIDRWVIKYSLQLEAAFHWRKRLVQPSSRQTLLGKSSLSRASSGVTTGEAPVGQNGRAAAGVRREGRG
jgi:hypothetical protein